MICYPAIPEEYEWLDHIFESGPGRKDIDLRLADIYKDAYGSRLIAWTHTDEEQNYYVRNRNNETGQHGALIEVESWQHGVDLISALLGMGLIGKGIRHE